MSYQYGQFGPEHLEKIRPGIECFNQQKYWECHEELEHVWLEDRQDPARNVYWAIIQVAAALVHYREKNLEGAKGMLNKAKNKFERCEKQNIETDLLEEKLSWNRFKTMSLSVPDEPQLADFKELYDFRFEDFSC
jgi:predicted metal-dependent hydrolase